MSVEFIESGKRRTRRRGGERKLAGILERTPLAVLFWLVVVPSLASGGALAQVVIWQSTGLPTEAFGSALSSLGDVNSDGVPDLPVGAVTWGPPLSTGKAYILSGADGASLDEFPGPVQQGFFGFRVAGAGDVTGDGTPDLLVGSILLGQARLYSGGDGSLVQTWNVGSSAWVAGLGDMNGDGVRDVLVGAPTATLAGEAYVFSGANYSNLLTISGLGANSFFGAGVAGTGDLDGDGVSDLLIGAPNNGSIIPGSTPPGHARVYSGATGAFLGEPIGPQTTNDSFGTVVAELGDVTGDGIPDFAIGAPGAYSAPGSSPGELRVFSGADMSLVFADTGTGFDKLGFSIAGSGDVDGDGVPDLIAGLPNHAPMFQYGFGGRANVYSGADWSLLISVVPPFGDSTNSGFAVAGPGDVNGDGFPDLAVGGPGSSSLPPGVPPNPGKVRVYSGAPVGVTAYGDGCPGASGEDPRIGASRSPKIGTTFSINLSRTTPARPALLLLGFSSSQWWGMPLPFDLDVLGVPGCSLLVSPDAPVGFTTLPFGPTQGRVVAPIPVPPDPGLVGFVAFAQWYVVDPGPLPIPGAMTRALQIVIQA